MEVIMIKYTEKNKQDPRKSFTKSETRFIKLGIITSALESLNLFNRRSRDMEDSRLNVTIVIDDALTPEECPEQWSMNGSRVNIKLSPEASAGCINSFKAQCDDYYGGLSSEPDGGTNCSFDVHHPTE
jgi:hypothetical protein